MAPFAAVVERGEHRARQMNAQPADRPILERSVGRRGLGLQWVERVGVVDQLDGQRVTVAPENTNRGTRLLTPTGRSMEIG